MQGPSGQENSSLGLSVLLKNKTTQSKANMNSYNSFDVESNVVTWGQTILNH